MFMDWKMQYCQHVNSPQIDIQIQHNPIQIPAGFLGKLILKFIWKDKGAMR